MLENEDARVPFAVVGVLLVIVSTIVTVYLVSMESVSITQGIGDDRERDYQPGPDAGGLRTSAQP